MKSADGEWHHYFERLSVEKRLYMAVAEMNQLLTHPQHRHVAVEAFRRIGLWEEEAERGPFNGLGIVTDL